MGRVSSLAQRGNATFGRPCGPQNRGSPSAFIPGTQPGRPCGGMRDIGGVWRFCLFCVWFGVVCRGGAGGGGAAVSASSIRLSSLQPGSCGTSSRSRGAGRGVWRARDGLGPPMLLIGISTANSHHNHRLTDARCEMGGGALTYLLRGPRRSPPTRRRDHRPRPELGVLSCCRCRSTQGPSP